MVKKKDVHQDQLEVEGYEVNFDGLVGPTHNYSGLSHGNIASIAHSSQVSRPLKAVLQGLEKMKSLYDLGLKQGILPPQERPNISTLKRLGFQGSNSEILAAAFKDFPELLSAVYSASSMWAANAATVSPSSDTADHKVHFTPANLVSKFHRSLEVPFTSHVLKKIFNDPRYFVHHHPLPSVPHFGDEGAANHNRFCRDYQSPGIEFFVYGRKAFQPGSLHPSRFEARQSLEASMAITRLHQLDTESVVYAQQHSRSIDAGVFHNDVVGVGNQDLYFYHEESFFESDQTMDELKQKFYKLHQHDLSLIQVPSSQVSLPEAVQSYLFNSQLITLPEREFALILPEECQQTPSVKRYIEGLLSDKKSRIKKAIFFDLQQSMANGGGPACLRLRVVLTKKELAATHSGVLFNLDIYSALVAWAKKHYRDQLTLADLQDPLLILECQRALDELTQILDLGSIYPFQIS